MNLAGKLIWYKDQILRSMTYAAMENEVALDQDFWHKTLNPEC